LLFGLLSHQVCWENKQLKITNSFYLQKVSNTYKKKAHYKNKLFPCTLPTPTQHREKNPLNLLSLSSCQPQEKKIKRQGLTKQLPAAFVSTVLQHSKQWRALQKHRKRIPSSSPSPPPPPPSSSAPCPLFYNVNEQWRLQYLR